jgi:hypothetical protein
MLLIFFVFYTIHYCSGPAIQVVGGEGKEREGVSGRSETRLIGAGGDCDTPAGPSLRPQRCPWGRMGSCTQARTRGSFTASPSTRTCGSFTASPSCPFRQVAAYAMHSPAAVRTVYSDGAPPCSAREGDAARGGRTGAMAGSCNPVGLTWCLPPSSRRNRATAWVQAECIATQGPRRAAQVRLPGAWASARVTKRDHCIVAAERRRGKVRFRADMPVKRCRGAGALSPRPV